ncbi:MAG TPA: hypothetical protein VHB48_13905 [Chitinophagaceae bacterium]|nr:hypothetical protein [Chitinophagaceae bacterium]
MKKAIIGALVGGVIIFIVQTLAWVVLNLHHKSQEYTPKQDSIMAFLSTQSLKTGQYLMPAAPPGSTMQQQEDYMKTKEGQPWASLSYHNAYKNTMTMNMVRVFLVNIVIVLLLCWIIGKMNSPSFGTIFITSILASVIVYLNSNYTYHIWYQTPGQLGYIIDYGAQWALTGIWLGWWLRKK